MKMVIRLLNVAVDVLGNWRQESCIEGKSELGI